MRELSVAEIRLAVRIWASYRSDDVLVQRYGRCVASVPTSLPCDGINLNGMITCCQSTIIQGLLTRNVLLHGLQETLRKVVNSSNVVVVLVIDMPRALDRCCRGRSVCNSHVSVRYLCALL